MLHEQTESDAGGDGMRDTKPQAQGWLRAEISAALGRIAQKSYISQEQKELIKQTADAINDSDRLRRAAGQTPAQSVA